MIARRLSPGRTHRGVVSAAAGWLVAQGAREGVVGPNAVIEPATLAGRRPRTWAGDPAPGPETPHPDRRPRAREGGVARDREVRRTKKPAGE